MGTSDWFQTVFIIELSQCGYKSAMCVIATVHRYMCSILCSNYGQLCNFSPANLSFSIFPFFRRLCFSFASLCGQVWFFQLPFGVFPCTCGWANKHVLCFLNNKIHALTICGSLALCRCTELLAPLFTSNPPTNYRQFIAQLALFFPSFRLVVQTKFCSIQLCFWPLQSLQIRGL